MYPSLVLHVTRYGPLPSGPLWGGGCCGKTRQVALTLRYSLTLASRWLAITRSTPGTPGSLSVPKGKMTNSCVCGSPRLLLRTSRVSNIARMVALDGPFPAGRGRELHVARVMVEPRCHWLGQ